jgi:hypothetical protein
MNRIVWIAISWIVLLTAARADSISESALLIELSITHDK